MSIVTLKKATLIGLGGDKGRLLEELQSMGCLHLCSLNPEEAIEGAESLEESTREAWRFLKDTPNQRIQVTSCERFDPAKIQHQALEVRDRLQERQDERDLLKRSIRALQPWGSFDFPSRDSLGGRNLWFYVLPHQQLHAIETRDDLVWTTIRRDHRYVYLVVVAEQAPSDMPIEPLDLGTRSLDQLQQRLSEVELEIDDLQIEREGLTRGLTIFEQNMDRLEDASERDWAARLTRDAGPVFALQAWIPHDKVDELQAFAADRGLALELSDPAPEETPPTLLDNPERLNVGESLVTFYMVPGYRLWDPSMLVLFSFTIFFAMIVSDAGYGLLMAAGLFLARHKLASSPGSRRVQVLFRLLAVATILWGVIAGSYFGLSPEEGSVLAQLKLIDLQDMGFMMTFSVLIGAIHIGLANFADHLRLRPSAGSLAPIGWIVTIASALILWLGGDDPRAESLGVIGLVIGLLGVVIFSAAGAEGGMLKRCFAGISSLTRITKAFGDILSYLRLFALGLASASLAMAFNDLAREANRDAGPLGFLLAAIIILVGHTINFVLCIVSGFVHGLRLNLIEFFNWSIDTEGPAFRPFRRRESAPHSA